MLKCNSIHFSVCIPEPQTPGCCCVSLENKVRADICGVILLFLFEKPGAAAFLYYAYYKSKSNIFNITQVSTFFSFHRLITWKSCYSCSFVLSSSYCNRNNKSAVFVKLLEEKQGNCVLVINFKCCLHIDFQVLFGRCLNHWPTTVFRTFISKPVVQIPFTF